MAKVGFSTIGQIWGIFWNAGTLSKVKGVEDRRLHRQDLDSSGAPI